MSLRKLSKSIKERAPRGVEMRRILADMEIYAARIASGEYKRARFVQNTLNINERNKELLDDLGFFLEIGQGWRKIFQEVKLSPQTSILDLGCGCFPKVELGLHYAGFKGDVFLIDQDRKNLRGAKTFLDFLQVDFNYVPLQRSFWSYRDRRFDVVAANHLLDDLLLSAYCYNTGRSLTKLHKSEGLYCEAWRKLARSSQFSHTLAERLGLTLDRLTKPGGRICLLDYPSHSHRALKLLEPWRVVQTLRSQLTEYLCARGYKQHILKGFTGIYGRSTNVPKAALLILQKCRSL